MEKIRKATRKIIVSVLGFSLLVFGLIAIPLPFIPGVPVVILALIVLSLEFTWAERHLDRAKSAYKKVIEKAKAKGENSKDS